jgi:hypothetical protein
MGQAGRFILSLPSEREGVSFSYLAQKHGILWVRSVYRLLALTKKRREDWFGGTSYRFRYGGREQFEWQRLWKTLDAGSV